MKKRKQNLPRPAVHRMELWWAALPTVPGHVQRGTRPVVIVSNDLGNASSPVVSVVPWTTQRLTYTSGVMAFPAAVSPCASR